MAQMRLQQKLLLVQLLLFTSLVYSQNNPELIKPTPINTFLGRNDIRVGLFFTRATIAYDRAVSTHFSLGMEGLAHWSDFPGFMISPVGRYYFKDASRSGFFLEEKISYGHFQATVYDTIYGDFADDITTLGEHKDNLNYFGNTLSIGYRGIGKTGFFIEMLAGFRRGIVTVSKNKKQMLLDEDGGIGDAYFYSLFTGYGMNYVIAPPGNVFNTIGPGCPFYFNIRVGKLF